VLGLDDQLGHMDMPTLHADYWHYPTDAITGLLMGYGIALTTYLMVGGCAVAGP
jgi:hypothetical protein